MFFLSEKKNIVNYLDIAFFFRNLDLSKGENLISHVLKQLFCKDIYVLKFWAELSTISIYGKK